MINTRLIRCIDDDTCNCVSKGEGPCILGGGDLGIGSVFDDEGKARCLNVSERIID